MLKLHRSYGGAITSLTRPVSVGTTSCTAANSAGSYCYSTGTGFAGDKSAAITINFTPHGYGARWATLTLYDEPQIRVESVSAATVPGGVRFVARGRLR